MNILITNDDGIDFKGLRTLVEEFSGIGNVYVVAPQGECSSNSHHLTIKGKIRYEEREVKGAKKAYALWGTPADCTHMALYYFFRDQIDLVVSGINKGPNISTDIIYSGTISAAREAFIHHVPAMALSLNSFTAEDYHVAAKRGKDIALKYLEAKDNTKYFLNVNIPALQEDEIKGIRVCDRIGEIIYNDSYSHVRQEEKDFIEIIGSDIFYKGDEDDERIDAIALKKGYVAISPLGNGHIDTCFIDDVKAVFKV